MIKAGKSSCEMQARKLKQFPFTPRTPCLAAAMQSCPVVLLINWCLQGMRGMDSKELAFRLMLEGLFASLVLTGLTVGGFGFSAALACALLMAHSASFLLNGQLWVCVRYCRFYRRDPRALDRFLERVACRLERCRWLDEALCLGSQGAGHGTPTPRSDIDLRLIFPAGLVPWLRTNLLLLALRAEALVRMVPLDLYAYDLPSSLARFRQDEPLLVLLDRHRRLHRALPHRRLLHRP